MRVSTVRAILFDLDGTLYHQVPLRFLMAMELGVLPLRFVSPTIVRRTVRAIKQFRTTREELRDRGRPSELLDRLQYRQAALEVGVSDTEMERIIHEWMYCRPLKYLKWCRRKGVLPFFREAHRKGIKLGVFSDYPAQEKLKALGLDSYVELVLCATDQDVNAFKPHSRGFLRACEKWSLPPNEVLYVGDRPEVDAKGASAVGMPYMIVGGAPDREFLGSESSQKISSFQRLQQMLAISVMVP